MKNTSLEVPLSFNGSTPVYTTEKAGEQPLARSEKLTKVSQPYFEVQPSYQSLVTNQILTNYQALVTKQLLTYYQSLIRNIQPPTHSQILVKTF